MQKQQSCSHKTWCIHIEIIFNGCCRISFKDTGKKHPQIKLQRFQKVLIWTLGSWYFRSNLYNMFLYWSKIKFFNKVYTEKTTFFVISPFCNPYYTICLNIGFWKGSFVCSYMLCFQLQYFQLQKYSIVF